MAKGDKTRKKIGVVGVDSGQLMVMDPCYVSDQWVNEGEVKAVKFWGRDWKKVGDLLKDSYDRDAYEYQGLCLVDVKSDSEADNVIADIDDILRKNPGLLVLAMKVTDSSYDKCCEITQGDDQGGQLNYLLGHEGLGVVFSSGFGDGTYDVYATYQDFGKWGTRVSKVEIILADEEGEDLMEEITSRQPDVDPELQEIPEA